MKEKYFELSEFILYSMEQDRNYVSSFKYQVHYKSFYLRNHI